MSKKILKTVIKEANYKVSSDVVKVLVSLTEGMYDNRGNFKGGPDPSEGDIDDSMYEVRVGLELFPADEDGPAFIRSHDGLVEIDDATHVIGVSWNESGRATVTVSYMGADCTADSVTDDKSGNSVAGYPQDAFNRVCEKDYKSNNEAAEEASYGI